jgi:hypothetical protein
MASVTRMEIINMSKALLMRAGLLAVIACVSACAVQKTMVPTSGSRADGTVEMSYEIGDMQTAKIDMAQAAKDAARRCQAWGYADAEPFGGEKRQCQKSGGLSGCSRTFVSMQYQCIGAGTPQ